jgi:hypothetical protein
MKMPHLKASGTYNLHAIILGGSATRTSKKDMASKYQTTLRISPLQDFNEARSYPPILIWFSLLLGTRRPLCYGMGFTEPAVGHAEATL